MLTPDSLYRRTPTAGAPLSRAPAFPFAGAVGHRADVADRERGTLGRLPHRHVGDVSNLEELADDAYGVGEVPLQDIAARRAGVRRLERRTNTAGSEPEELESIGVEGDLDLAPGAARNLGAGESFYLLQESGAPPPRRSRGGRRGSPARRPRFP